MNKFTTFLICINLLIVTFNIIKSIFYLLKYYNNKEINILLKVINYLDVKNY